jgi:hypothetical protein
MLVALILVSLILISLIFSSLGQGLPRFRHAVVVDLDASGGVCVGCDCVLFVHISRPFFCPVVFIR